jgi:hypothetical protein
LNLELKLTLWRGWCVIWIWHDGTGKKWFKNILTSLTFHSKLGFSPHLTFFQLLWNWNQLR